MNFKEGRWNHEINVTNLAINKAIARRANMHERLGTELFILVADILPTFAQKRFLDGRNAGIGVDLPQYLLRLRNALQQRIEVGAAAGLRRVDVSETQYAIAERNPVTGRAVEELHLARGGVEPRVTYHHTSQLRQCR